MKKLILPHITEKLYRTITEKNDQPNTYTFKVNSNLDKHHVKRLIEKEFKVTVTDVRIANIPGKKRRFKGIIGQTSSVKKAIVKLKKGDRLADFDNIQAAQGEKE